MFLIRGNFIDQKSDNKTIEELGIDSSTKIVVDEDNQDMEMMSIEGCPPPQDFQTSLANLKMIFEHISDDILLLALEKSDNQVEDAVILLTDEQNLEKLHIQTEKAKITIKKPVEAYRLSNILTNTQEYFNLLFELFSFGNLRMNSQIWCLLSKIPMNDRIFNEMKNLEFNGDWNTLLDSRCIFKLLYSLQIVNSIISSDDCDQ